MQQLIQSVALTITFQCRGKLSAVPAQCLRDAEPRLLISCAISAQDFFYAQIEEKKQDSACRCIAPWFRSLTGCSAGPRVTMKRSWISVPNCGPMSESHTKREERVSPATRAGALCCTGHSKQRWPLCLHSIAALFLPSRFLLTSCMVSWLAFTT